jgi:signal transduction histidine kinase/putative methionine-R-sulfoxide reductase with GAF domain
MIDRMALLAEIARSITSSLELDVVLPRIAEAARQLCGSDTASIFLRDAEGAGMLPRVRAGSFPPGYEGLRVTRGQGIGGRAWEAGRPVRTAHYLAEAAVPEAFRDAARQVGVVAVMVVPIVMAGEVEGLLYVGNQAARPFTDADEAFCVWLGHQAAIALRNASLFTRERRLRTEAELLAALAPQLSASLDVDRVLQSVAEAARDVADADVVRIALRDESDGVMRYRYLVGTRATGYERLALRPGLGFVGKTLETGRPYRTADAYGDAAVHPDYGREFIVMEGVKTAMVVPVRRGDIVIGLIYSARRRQQPFSDDDERIVCRFAEFASVALRNAQLHAEAERRRREAEIFGEVLRQLSSSLELDTVLQRIVDGARELCDADVAWITRPVGAGPAHTFRYMAGTRFQGWRDVLIEPGRGMGGLALTSANPVRTEDYRSDPRFSKEYVGAIETEGIIAQLVVPIRWADRVEGLLYVSRRTARPFTMRDETLLGRLADQAAIVLHNVGLVAREQAARADAEATERRASFLAQASVLLAASLDVEATLRSVARLTVPFLADFCAVDMIGERGQPQRVVAVHADPAREALVRELRDRHGFNAAGEEGVPRVLASGRSAFVPHVTDEHLRAAATSDAQLAILRELKIGSWVIVPLVARGRVLGAITLVMAESGRRYAVPDVAMAEDLARRAAVAIENAQLYREAQLANQAKDEFLATLSHELRTPINAVYGWARMLRNDRMDPPTRDRGLEAIERNAHAQVQLIDDLLDVSRIVAGKLRLEVRPIDVAVVIEAALDAVRPAAEAKGVRLQTVLDPRAAPIMGDPDRLQQVVWNLLMNAIKFTPRGGRIEVTLRRINSHLEAVVADTGAGIEPALLPHLFERFRQGDRARGGLGIGLALVRHLVELHGGTVAATSEGPGHGAAFTVKLPLAVASRLPDLPAPALPSSSAGGATLEGVEVLVVDDDPDTLDLLRAILAAAGAAVRSAASAAEAIKHVEARPPHVIVSDVEMPGENGYALVRRVRQRPREAGGAVPVVALTAYSGLRERIQALEAGFDMHMPKPVDPVELTAVLVRLVRRA